MAKTLKQMLEVYKPKAADEQKFADKHIVAKHSDPNGNGDDVFQGTNVKKIDRKKERHGYDAGDDEKVYEEKSDNAGKFIKGFEKSDAPQFQGKSKAKRRDMAIAAFLNNKKGMKEEVVVEEEGSIPKTPREKELAAKHGDKTRITHGDVLKARGVSMKKEEAVDESILNQLRDRGNVATGKKQQDRKNFDTNTGASLKPNRTISGIRAKMQNKVQEEAEVLDELSKSTLGSYVKKAAADSTITRKIGADFENRATKVRSPTMKASAISLSDKFKSDSRKRKANVDKAVDRLTKEEVEHLEEGDVAHAQFQHYHNETAKLVKNIHGALGKHFDAVTDKKNYMNGQAHWGHVGTIKDIHRSLQDIHDRVLEQGEYAKPAKVMKEETEMDSEVDVTLLSLYVNLDEDNRASMIRMLDEGRKEELLEFAATVGAE